MLKSVAASAALVLSVGVLAACGSSTDSGSSPAPSSPSASPSDGMVGGDPSTWSPVEVTPEMNGQTVEMVVGQNAVFRGLPEGSPYRVEATDGNVVAVSIPSDDVTTAVGFSAAAPGSSEVTVFDAAGEPVLTLTVKVAGDGMVGGDPSTWSPVEVTPAMNGQTVEMAPGQAGLFTGLPDRLVVVESSDLNVVAVYQVSDDGTTQTSAGFQALAPGSATVKVVDGADRSVLIEFTVAVVE